MDYREIGQKEDYSFLDVRAATYCRATNHIYLSLHIMDSGTAVDIED
jgi:hypothetical protein